MKRGLISVILFVAVVATALTTSVIISKRIDTLSELADKAYISWENAEELTEAWDKNKTFFSVFLGHNHFEQINASADALKYLNGDEYYTACAEIIVRLEELKDHVSFSIGNLL